MKHHFMAMVGAIAVAGFAHNAALAGTLVTNGGFQTPTAGIPFSAFNAGSTGITGWTVVNNQIALQANGTGGIVAPNSTQYLDLTGTNDGLGLYGGVTQSISTNAGQSYLLTFDVGNYSTQTSTVGVTAQAGGYSKQFTVAAPLSGYNWVGESLPFTASGPTTQITLTGTGGYYYTGLADVAVSGAPEPASWALMLLGIGGIGAGMRMSKRGSLARLTSA